MPAPIANPDQIVAARDRGVTYFTSILLRNDDDEVPMTLTVTAVTPLTGGSVQLNPDGTFTFTPDPGFTGAASFQYTVTDETGLSSVSTVTVDVRDVDAPGASPFLGIIALNFGDTIEGSGSGDLMVGDGGIIYGRGGNDLLLGGDTGNYLDAGAGHDIVFGGNGEDFLEAGESGNDQLFAGGGNDRLFVRRFGTQFNDTLVLDGGAGNDRFTFESLGITQTVILSGGTGDDDIMLENGGVATIDAGEGNDIVAVGSYAGALFTVTLGPGADWLIPGSGYYSQYGGLVTTVTDFEAGTAGDRADIELLVHFGSTWDGTGNPFASGFLLLEQRGADVALRLDGDGGGDSYRDVIVFEDTDAVDLLPYNTGFSGDGSVTPGEMLDGTSGADRIIASGGDDNIRGFEGGDTLVGGGGDDEIDGGDGNDKLDGRSGNDVLLGGADDDTLTDFYSGDDQLFGGAGNDLLDVDHSRGTASDVLLDGGTGNDELRYRSYTGEPPTVEHVATIIGGDGNDYVSTVSGYRIDIDTGAGDDRLYLGLDDAEIRVTLGTGRDEVEIHNAPQFSRGIDITDFEAGALGDIIDVPAIVFYMSNIPAGANPFSTGHLRAIQSGTDTLIDVDFSGGAQWRTLFRLENFVATNLVPENLSGFSAGAIGDQTYSVSDPATQVVEWLGGGNDLVLASVSYTLLANAEVERLEANAPGSTAAIDLVGSDLANAITGNAGANILNGRGGADVLSGLGGDDTLIGGAGVDDLRGGTGNDRYFIEDALDQVTEAAGAGMDRVFASISYTLSSSAEVEQLLAADRFSTAGLNLFGNDFANIVHGNNGTNLLAGAGGADTLFGYNGNDLLDGGAAGDQLSGGEGDDRLFGQDGNDRLDGDFGADVLEGGLGKDTADYAGEYGGVWVDLATGIGRWNSAQGDTLGLIENVIGTDWTDWLTGNGDNNRLEGGKANDRLLGNAGNDVLVGGLGADVLDGGANVDTADYSGNYGGVWINFMTGQGKWNYAEGDTLAGIEKVIGTSFADTFESNGVTNVFTGGLGNDTFVFRPGFSQDIITDFAGNGAAAGDTLRFRTGIFTGYDDMLAHASQQGADVLIQVDAANFLRLQNVQLADLHSSDFIFG